MILKQLLVDFSRYKTLDRLKIDMWLLFKTIFPTNQLSNVARICVRALGETIWKVNEWINQSTNWNYILCQKLQNKSFWNFHAISKMVNNIRIGWTVQKLQNLEQYLTKTFVLKLHHASVSLYGLRKIRLSHWHQKWQSFDLPINLNIFRKRSSHVWRSHTSHWYGRFLATSTFLMTPFSSPVFVGQPSTLRPFGFNLFVSMTWKELLEHWLTARTDAF